MKTETIFVIHGEEATKKQSSIKKNGKDARNSDNPTINYWSGLHVFSVLCCCGLAMSIITLIPRHDSMIDHTYWFEINILTATICFILTAFMVLDFIVLFEQRSWVTTRFFLKNYLATFLTWIIWFCTSYIIWTMVLEHNHPMPFTGVILAWPTLLASVVSLPLMLPREYSHEKDTKKKLKDFVWFQFKR